MFPLKDSEPSGISPIITITIILLCAIALLIEFSAPDLEQLLLKWALVPSLINLNKLDTLYPLITSIFLHGGITHFASNMWFLWIFGDNVEAVLGKVKFILFYITGGIVASLAEIIFISNPNIPILGASGAIAAILGFYLIYFPHHTIKTLLATSYLTTITLPAQFVLVFWFITQFFNGVASLVPDNAFGGIAWWAHIGGFLYGILIAFIVRSMRPQVTYE